MTDALDRIAAALERLAPPPPAADDPLTHPAYLWHGSVLQAARGFAPLPLDRLTGIDAQRDALLANLQRHAAGHAAHDVLLWGSRGSGKSALVASAAAATSVALVQVAGHALATLPALFAELAPIRRAFAVFVDDLGFGDVGEARTLRSLLEGGAEARPVNVRLLVTSNRRHLLPRSHAEDSINPRDATDDQLALADRFGLSLGFHAIDQDTYLAIVRRYAEAAGLPFDPADAVGWASARGGRSGRVAWQYAVELAGRHGRRI